MFEENHKQREEAQEQEVERKERHETYLGFLKARYASVENFIKWLEKGDK